MGSRQRNMAADKRSAFIGAEGQGPGVVPREFVFMDRAAIGLGGVFIHLRTELNFYRLFNQALEGFSVETVAERQRAALDSAGLGL